jgi:hypothetical protein
MVREEGKYKSWIVKKSGVWVTKFEPGFGGDFGVPDLGFLVGEKWQFLELKIGEIFGGKLKCSEIRPSQFSWHRNFRLAGGRSAFFSVGVREGKEFRNFILPFPLEEFKLELKSGFDLGQVYEWKFQDEKVFGSSLQDWRAKFDCGGDEGKIS